MHLLVPCHFYDLDCWGLAVVGSDSWGLKKYLRANTLDVLTST